MNPVVYAMVCSVVEKLSLDEMAALTNAVTCGFDPRPVLGYNKAKSLFTEADGKKMHSAMQEAFEEVVSERIEELLS